MRSLDLFIDWFKEYYRHEFLNISRELKEEAIEEVLLNNAQYISKQEVLDFDGCIRCGECCKIQHCKLWDPKTKLCTNHDNQISFLCREYPWTGELGIAPLLLNCRYQVSFFINFFDKLFKILEEDDA